MRARQKLLDGLRVKLCRQEWPRLQMLVIVSLTGAVGFLSSAALLWLQVRSLPLRWGLAVVLAYAAFFGFIRLWIGLRRGDVEVDGNLPDDADMVVPDAGCAEPDVDAGGGFSLDFDDAAVVLVLLAAAAVAFVAAIYVVATAPTLFAEVLLDGVVSAGLYKRLRQAERRHWAESTFVRTRFPLLATLVVAVAAGAVVQGLAPDAVTLTDLLERPLERQ